LGKRGPKPLSASVVRLHGNPSRLSKAELEARAAAEVPVSGKPLGSCPRFLQGTARAEFHRLRRLLAARGTPALEIDRSLLAMLATCWADWRTAQELIAGMAQTERIDPRTNRIHPAYAIARRAAAQVLALSKAFQITPQARGAVLIDPPPAAGQESARGSPWDQFR
jgi:P27 family predicted phage terminase small subunit